MPNSPGYPTPFTFLCPAELKKRLIKSEAHTGITLSRTIQNFLEWSEEKNLDKLRAVPNLGPVKTTSFHFLGQGGAGLRKRLEGSAAGFGWTLSRLIAYLLLQFYDEYEAKVLLKKSLRTSHHKVS